MNNHTTARTPLKPGAERRDVLRALIDGNIVRHGHGPFYPAEAPLPVSQEPQVVELQPKSE